jgi:hypothetical protein
MRALLAVLGILVLLGIAASSSGSSGTASHSATHDPPKFASMSSLLTSDATKTSSDLRLVATDAANGQNGPGGETACYNLLNNVTPETRAIGTFVANNVDSDVSNLQRDIKTLEADIGNFNEDITDFANDGVQTPTGAATVSQIKAVIAAEIESANSLIATMQDNVNMAYADGNDLAFGACQHDGPGKAPRIPTVTS